jgi:hypothetical protein
MVVTQNVLTKTVVGNSVNHDDNSFGEFYLRFTGTPGDITLDISVEGDVPFDDLYVAALDPDGNFIRTNPNQGGAYTSSTQFPLTQRLGYEPYLGVYELTGWDFTNTAGDPPYSGSTSNRVIPNVQHFYIWWWKDQYDEDLWGGGGADEVRFTLTYRESGT